MATRAPNRHPSSNAAAPRSCQLRRPAANAHPGFRARRRSYSHKAISEFLGKRRRGEAVACPVAGCGKTVSLDQLVEDKELAKEIKKRNR